MTAIIVDKLHKIAHNIRSNGDSNDVTFKHGIFDTFLSAIEDKLEIESFTNDFKEPFEGYTLPFADLADEFLSVVRVSAPWEDLLGEVFSDFGLQSPTFPNFSWKDAMIYASKNVKTAICILRLKTRFQFI